MKFGTTTSEINSKINYYANSGKISQTTANALKDAAKGDCSKLKWNGIPDKDKKAIAPFTESLKITGKLKPDTHDQLIKAGSQSKNSFNSSIKSSSNLDLNPIFDAIAEGIVEVGRFLKNKLFKG